MSAVAEREPITTNAPAPEAKPAGLSQPIVKELSALIRQSSHYLLGMLGGMALGMVSFPIFTRLFSVGDYGLIDFAQKILILATAVGKAGMQNSTLRFFDRERFTKTPGEAQRFYSTMFFGVAGVSLALTVMFFLGVRLLPASIVDRPLADALSLIAILILIRALQSIQLSFLRIEERTKAYNSVSLGGRALVIVSVVAFVYAMGPSVKAYLSGLVVAELMLSAVLSGPLVRRRLLAWKAVDWALLVSALSFGVPLVLQELAGIILDTGDRALVRMYLGDTALGHYSVAYGLAGYVSTLLMTPLGLAILPIYMRLWRSEGREKTIEFLSIGLDVFLLAAAGLFAVAFVSSQDAVVLLASAKYSAAAPLIPTLVAGLLIYAVQIFLNAGLVIKKDTRMMAIAFGIAAVINAGLNCLLLPQIGMQGAAIATLLSYIICTLLLAHLSFKFLRLQVFGKSLAAYAIAAAITCLTVPRLDFHSGIGNLLAKSFIAVILYGALVYGADARMRSTVEKLWRKFGKRTEVIDAVEA